VPKPTKEDARLLLQLVELGQNEFSREARRWLFTEFSAQDYDEFIKKYPRGSIEHGRMLNILGFFETVGVLVSRGLLNEDLFFDLSFGLEPVWEKVAPIIPGWQKAASPALWENVQWLANRSATWRKKVWKQKVKSTRRK
jgi:hypothetical protein